MAYTNASIHYFKISYVIVNSRRFLKMNSRSNRNYNDGCKRQLYNVGNRQFKIVGFPTFFIYLSYPLFRNGGTRMRKDIREGVKKHMIDGIKPNYAALAKQYGCDYRTVKTAYHEADNVKYDFALSAN